jgi:CubicO group peptidase (beta-lactamase class C family)
MTSSPSYRQSGVDGFEGQRIERLDRIVAGHVERGEVGGVVWLAARDGDVVVGAEGSLIRGVPGPVGRSSLFRIASLTKPIVAAAALLLVEGCVLRLDDPVDPLLPELAGRRVLVDPSGPLDGPTVAASRPVTLRDLLTSRMGWGMDVDGPWPQPFLQAMEALGLPWGAPEPAVAPEPDEWLRRIAPLPLLDQPGTRWRYNTASDVLGILLARAAGRPLDRFLAEELFKPLGMVDTGFWTEAIDRLGACHRQDEHGRHVVHDPPNGQWSAPPAFPSGAGGLLCTVDDLYAFGSLLLSGGRAPSGERMLSAEAVRLMTTDHLGVDRGAVGPLSDGSQGWGFGVGVQLRHTAVGEAPGSYGWAGGLGSSWRNDPVARTVVVVLTTDQFQASGRPPAVIPDVHTAVHAALAG